MVHRNLLRRKLTELAEYVTRVADYRDLTLVSATTNGDRRPYVARLFARQQDGRAEEARRRGRGA